MSIRNPKRTVRIELQQGAFRRRRCCRCCCRCVCCFWWDVKWVGYQRVQQPVVIIGVIQLPLVSAR